MPNPGVVLGNACDVPVVKPFVKADGLGTPNVLLLFDVEVELNTNPGVFVELMQNPGVVLGNACDVPVVKPFAKADGLGTPNVLLLLDVEVELNTNPGVFVELMPNPGVVLGNACDVPVVKPFAKADGLITPNVLLLLDVEVELNTNPGVFVELMPNPGVVLGNACDVPVVKPFAIADGLGTPNVLLLFDVEVELNTNPGVFVELMPNPGVVLGNACDVPVVKPFAKADGLGTPKIDEFVLPVAELDEPKPNPNTVPVPEEVGKPKKDWLDGAGSGFGPQRVFDDPANTKIIRVLSHQGKFTNCFFFFF
ncbi:hypothetical protein CASFOL_035642 [Castilleja foliolosa]|uniref:Uncharacterized protein n=1 Tax=Castilleja foliolosa TaxID=1961234 RepID=A0ABD3BT84_9LAMI